MSVSIQKRLTIQKRTTAFPDSARNPVVSVDDGWNVYAYCRAVVTDLGIVLAAVLPDLVASSNAPELFHALREQAHSHLREAKLP